MQSQAVAFLPSGKTSWFNASTESQNLLLSAKAPQIQVLNQSSGVAHMATGLDESVEASIGEVGTSTSDYPVAPGACVVFSIQQLLAASFVAVILESGSGSVFITPGQGV
jgi:hypothetical protein